MSKAKKIKPKKTKQIYELAGGRSVSGRSILPEHFRSLVSEHKKAVTGGAAVSQASIRRIKRELDDTAIMLQARARDYD